MASIKNIFFLLAILVSSTVTLPQGPKSNDSRSDAVSPNTPHEHGNGSDEEPPLLSLDQILTEYLFSNSSELGRGVIDVRQKRSIHGRVINCDYATDGFLSCTDCNTVRRCSPLNIGAERTCSFLLPYCHKGLCSRTKGSQCSAASSSSSTTKSSTTK